MTLRVAHPPFVPPDCDSCPVRRLTVCRAFGHEELSIVQAFKMCDRVLPAGTTLYAEGERLAELYHLLDGWLMLYRMRANGRRQILGFVLPGAFLGYQPDPEEPMPHSAQCLTDASVCVFPRYSFQSFMREHPSVAVNLAQLQARDGAYLHDQLTNIGTGSARERLAYLLLELDSRARHWYPPTHEDAIEWPLTQDHLADALGLTNVYINKMMRSLREEGVVETERRRLRVLDAKRLAAIGELDSRSVCYPC